jgi:hypothetical protein
VLAARADALHANDPLYHSVSGLLRQIDRSQRCVSVEDAASLDKALAG